VVTEIQPIQILVDFFIMLVIGSSVILLSKRFNFPISILLLLSGILISPNTFGLNIMGNSGILYFFLYLSIFFVILSSVLDFPLLKIRDFAFLIFIVTTIEIFFMTSILYYFGLILLKLSSVDSFFLSFSITISSQSIFFSIFSYRFKTRSLITIIQGIIFLENLTAIFFLSLFNVIFPSHELNRFEFLFQIFLLTAFTGSLIIIGGYLIPKFINKIYLSRDLLLAFVFILIGLIAIGGILIGVNPYTLIFILGMIIGITKARETISEIIYPFKEIFSIFFYITFGFLINIFYFPSIYHIIFSVIILSVTVKYLSITFTLISFGYISKKSLPIISFTQPGEITLIIALISYLSNIISSLTFNSIIFVVIFITIINFLLLHFIKRFQISIKQK